MTCRLFQVSTNGAVSFGAAMTSYTSEAFPIANKIITPFWADVDINNGGDICYRESSSTADISKATQIIRSLYPTLTSFSAKAVFVATWKDVHFFGSEVEKVNYFKMLSFIIHREYFCCEMHVEVTLDF